MRDRPHDADTATLIVELRRRRGWSQAELARRAGTSQPAIARYENAVTTPAVDTLRRLLGVLGYRLSLDAAPDPDDHDVELARQLLALDPSERLRTLTRYAALRASAQVAS